MDDKRVITVSLAALVLITETGLVFKKAILYNFKNKLFRNKNNESLRTM